jgi:Kelch motif.
MPVAMGGMGYSIVDQNMYLAGTWNGGLGSTLHYRYDIVADAWTQMADVPVNIYRPASASIGTNTYLVGGGDPFVAPRASPKARKLASTRAPATSFNTTYVYDTVADTWSSGPNTNAAHSFTGGTAIGNSLIVVTGFDGNGDTNTVEKSDCGRRRDTNTYADSNANTDAWWNLSAGNYRVDKPGHRGWQLSGVQQRGWHYREPLLPRL